MKPSSRIEPRQWMAETVEVLTALSARGETVRFVGGCVRDTLLDRPIADIDIATPDRPETVMALAAAAGLRALPTGLDHGTVTVVSQGRAYEVTTLRRDVETFGRHARVAFTDDWAADAARRDFTFNAMFLDPDGTLYDAHGGAEDLAAGRVRFVGDAARRIEEDVLRLLRFFRFLASYGRGEADADALDACAAAAGRLEALSGERVQAELLKLLAAADPLPTLTLMAERGVLAHLLPQPRADWPRRLGALIEIERTRGSNAVRRLAAMVGAEPEALAERLRLSRADSEHLCELVAAETLPEASMSEPGVRRALYDLGKPRFMELALLAAADAGDDGPYAGMLAQAESWDIPTLPVSGRDALALGIEPGPEVGTLLRAVEAWWIDGDFSANRGAALAKLEVLMATASGAA
jgi:poly(A) polymerase